jgi:DNA polymerase I-like protein with 3'-5' exonuclease and polymerase domains
MLVNDSNWEACKKALNAYNFDDWVSIDLETISFDDKVKALYPYKGCRTALFIIRQGGECYSIPLRHRTLHTNLDFDKAIEFLKEFVGKIKFYKNQNPKFDLRFMAQDGIFLNPDARVRDTQVLGRLVKSDMMSYSLENMCKFYDIKNKKSDAAKTWTKQSETEDYGAIPWSILVPYGEDDVYATDSLAEHLESKIPEESKPQLELEDKFCKLLFDCEHTGISIDVKGLMKKRIVLIQDIIKIHKRIYDIVGDDKFNPNSRPQIDKFFRTLGVDPIKFTDETHERGCWDKNILALVSPISHGQRAYDFATALLELGMLGIQESTFCASWIDHADENGVIHPDFRQTGTNTGRLSCGDPNAQNFPEWMSEYLIIPNGYVGIKWDLKQIEYRIFTHYSNNLRLLAAYAENSDVDFHQIIADLIGIPRKPVKPINFGILYGMGIKKLTASIIKAICESDGIKLRTALGRFTEHAIPEFPEAIPHSMATEIAGNILSYYHSQTPEIKQMVKKIKSVLSVRGYIKNFFGRRIYLPIDKAYVGLNYLIQGSSADLFKRFLVAIHSECPEAKLIDNIHDADMSIVPIEHAQKFWNVSKRIIDSCDLFKVPIRMDGAIAINRWNNYAKIKNDSDILSHLSEVTTNHED